MKPPVKHNAVFELLLTGKCFKEIANEVGISTRQAKWHASNVYAKQGVQDRIQLMAKFIRRDTDEKEHGTPKRDARKREAELTAS